MKRKLVVAIGLALIAMLSLWLYSRSLEKEVAGGQKVTVLVAGQEIAAGARLTKSMLAMRDMPEAYVHPASILKGEENKIIGRPVAAKIAQGQAILWSDFEMTKVTGKLSGRIQKGQRAITIPVDNSGSHAGMLQRGDRVDILGTFARNQGTDWATVTLLQNVPVLEIGDGRHGDDMTGGAAQPRSFTSITLAVDLEEAELLVFAIQRGPINIVLRGTEDMETVDDVPDKTFGDIFEMQKRAAFTRKRAAKKIEALKTQ
jgi:pilus assembly protein CpaB